MGVDHCGNNKGRALVRARPLCRMAASCETALNSSTDVLFTAVAEKSRWKKA